MLMKLYFSTALSQFQIKKQNLSEPCAEQKLLALYHYKATVIPPPPWKKEKKKRSIITPSDLIPLKGSLFHCQDPYWLVLQGTTLQCIPRKSDMREQVINGDCKHPPFAVKWKYIHLSHLQAETCGAPRINPWTAGGTYTSHQDNVNDRKQIW